MFFDCCYSGGTGDAKGSAFLPAEFKSGLDETLYERLSHGHGRVIITSSRSDEVSLVYPEMGNSLFTYFLLAAGRGEALSRGDGLIRVFDILDYVSEQVPTRGSQHPVFKAADLESNFPVALYLGDTKPQMPVSPAHRYGTSVEKRDLRQVMLHSFNLEELHVLCADVSQDLAEDGISLTVSLEMVRGVGKEAIVLNLCDYLDRRGHLAYLVRAIRRQRPGAI